MEESMISTNYISKSMCSSDEESRWTSYLEDFMACGRGDDNALNQSPSDSLLLSGSFASESPCSGVKKKNRFHSHDDGEVDTGRISAKKRKTNVAAFVDRDLEDDACSPDHTPKANYLSHLFMDSKEMTGSGSVFHEHILSHKLNKQQDDGICNGTYQGKGNIFNQNTQSYCTELRRKGLCLVPVSILFNRVSN